MEQYIFKVCGIIGLVLIISGIYARKEVRQDGVFAVGGIFLLVYSIYLRDVIFIILQSAFIMSSVYEMFKLKKQGAKYIKL